MAKHSLIPAVLTSIKIFIGENNQTRLLHLLHWLRSKNAAMQCNAGIFMLIGKNFPSNKTHIFSCPFIARPQRGRPTSPFFGTAYTWSGLHQSFHRIGRFGLVVAMSIRVSPYVSVPTPYNFFSVRGQVHASHVCGLVHASVALAWSPKTGRCSELDIFDHN